MEGGPGDAKLATYRSHLRRPGRRGLPLVMGRGQGDPELGVETVWKRHDE